MASHCVLGLDLSLRARGGWQSSSVEGPEGFRRFLLWWPLYYFSPLCWCCSPKALLVPLITACDVAVHRICWCTPPRLTHV
jgi:hypothetical protein